MATPRMGTFGKRMLPIIPAEVGGVKREVTFKCETTETSIGGTVTAGHIKPGSLSPANRLSNDTSLASVSSLSITEEESVCSMEEQSLNLKTADERNNSNMSIEVSVNCDSDKENYPDDYRNCKITIDKVCDNKMTDHVSCIDKDNGYSYNFKTFNGVNDLTPLHLFPPSPTMKVHIPFRRHTMDDRVFGTPECYSDVQWDKTKYEFGLSDNSTDNGEDSCSVTVAVRVRPFSQRELSDQNVHSVVHMFGNEITVKTDSGLQHRFTYDFAFSSFNSLDPEYASQKHVYDNLAKPLLCKAFEGYNTCLFAYGQTGSGKSYCIMGHGEDIGIIPRFCEELFSRADVARDLDKVKVHVEISFFEIYNEKIHDLLASSNKEKKTKKITLRVREHPVLGPYVEGLSTFVVNSFDDVKGWITLGNKNRATAATGMNDKSSRSHSVFTIVLTQTKTEVLEGQEHDHSINSKINLVDLAGSERQSQAQTSGERLREGANINKSLLTLGKVISQLAEQSTASNKKKKFFIPYRDSVLTWLLKESLGGNSKTAMIATISPANHHMEETLSTLRYAQTARSIVNIVRVNEDPKAKLIKELRAEIERLRSSGLSGNDDVTALAITEINTLKEQLAQKEREMEEITKSWQARLKQAEERKQEEAKMLEKAGITLKVNNQLPNFVNLNEDPQLSEMLLYNIKEGLTKVGRMGPDSKHDIQLNGALIADNHCIIGNMETVVTITPIGDAPTYVNGNLISDPTTLHHGDRVILGGDHYFRFNHPIEVQTSKKSKSSQLTMEIKDFEFAKSELMRVQEARLQEARQQAQEEMLEEVEKAKKAAEIKLADMEKLMREESEEKVRAAEDAIHTLKREKRMLEHEVIAGRKRQQLEAEAAMKASSQPNASRSKILELLQTQREQVTQRLEELKQKRNDFYKSRPIKSPSSNIVEVSAGKKDLYKIALQVREANKICQYLKKYTVFSREDFLDGDDVKTIIKMTNTKLNVCTHWTLSKFEEKLVQMRDLYQNEGESTDDDDLFNDPEDQWGKDTSSLSLLSPQSVQRSFPSPSIRQALLSSMSSNTSVNNSMYMHDSLGRKGDNSMRCSVAGVCKNIINITLSGVKSSSVEESVADYILKSCHVLKACLRQLENLPDAMETNNNNSCRQDILQLVCVQMTSAFHLLLSNSMHWSSVYQNLQSALIQDLLTKIGDHSKAIGGQIVIFLQGCDGDIDSLIEESSCRLLDTIHQVCKFTGELALATDTQMVFFDNASKLAVEDTSVTSEVCQSFFHGCETFIDKTLQGALRTVEDFETRAQVLSDNGAANMNMGNIRQNVELCVTSCKDLLVMCQHLQVEIDTTILERSFQSPIQFNGGSYCRNQSLISHISTLVDWIGLLVANTEQVVEGRDFDIRKLIKCGENVGKCTESLVDSMCQDKPDKEAMVDLTTLSEQILQIHCVLADVQQAVTSLVNSAQTFIENKSVTNVTTPRGKRLLPSPLGKSPSKRISNDES